MKKLKFFLDPITQVAPWLNKWESIGYTLSNVDKYSYIFKEEDREVLYETIYVGDYEIKQLEGYKKYLQSQGKRYFHIPLDQGGLITGDLGFLRPFSKQAERLESTFSTKNREILIIESQKSKPENPENNYAHLSKEYRSIANKYIASLLFVLLGIFLVARSIYKDGFRLLAGIALILLAIFLFDYLVLVIFSNKNYEKYRKKANEEV